MIASVPNLSAANHLIARIASGCVVLTDAQLETVTDEVRFFLSKNGKEPPLIFPGFGIMPYEEKPPERENLYERIRFFHSFDSKNKSVVISEPQALIYRMPDIIELQKKFKEIYTGKRHPVERVIRELSEYGYERADKVLEKGQYCVRGGIVDCFISLYDEPVRIEFFDETVESMRFFSVDTQLSTRKTDRIVLAPVNEFGKSFIAESVWHSEDLSFCPIDLFKDFDWIIVGEVDFDKLYEIADWRYQSRGNLELPLPETILSDKSRIKAIEAGSKKIVIAPGIDDSEYSEPELEGKFSDLIDKIKNLSARFNVEIVGEKNSAKGLFDSYPEIGFSHGRLGNHFCTKEDCFISFEKLFGKKAAQSRTHKNRIRTIFDVDDLVVHKDYGIGRFEGIVEIDEAGCKSQMYKIRYRDDELLYQSVINASDISRYEGPEPEELDRLSGNAFKIRKKKAYEEIMRMAKRFAAIYAKRHIARRLPYDLENPYLFEFERIFPYRETADQQRAIDEIKSDMSKDIPMDRLITGGTGYGKTEVILRAAAIAVFSGRQVLVASPTTVLSNQHYELFCKRFSDFPINIARADRLNKNDNLDGCDILIGTQKTARFADRLKHLSLVIIDEEQRFGVNFKERFKKSHPEVDFLMASATPIPRTMQMALSGIWDINSIETAPEGRIPIITEIRIKSDRAIQDIILWELRRKGQIYYVHNRIEDIGEVYDKLVSLVKDVRIAIVHGRLGRAKIQRLMKDFRMHKYDILLSTSIVESGLDIPEVNTIVVDEEENFGLADLYQLRGRVGRSDRAARAIFFIKNPSGMTENAKKRLTALKEFSRGYGSAFDLAVRDSKIRGSGNPLGVEQKGKSYFLGFSLYYQMVREAVSEIKGLAKPDHTAEISWDLPSYIPDYLMSQKEKLIWYQRISEADNNQLDGLQREAVDRYGKLPEEFRNLFTAAKLKNRAGEIGIKKIDLHNRRVLLKFKNNPPVATCSIINIIDSHYRGKAGFAGANDLYFNGVESVDLHRIIDNLRKAI